MSKNGNDLQKFNINKISTEMSLSTNEKIQLEKELNKKRHELIVEGIEKVNIDENISKNKLAIVLAKKELKRTKKFSIKRKLIKLAINELEKRK
ncbi:hypothetical protein BUY92_10120 [Staphylococcus equorum]|uniref:hypothetical protein n=1 Tax=Staphylococcus equorum TaxID=246432 RepID=UPI000D1CBFDA|nr:hypothetical protein [Staphylococcus equorum]MEB7852939.1 hypothetical protein [Staphylococcus equorum]PTE24457.1 hypothetical protein BUY92_10120 [Staphylococcus equorum]PTE28724.1 hypothetical protein BUY83_11100 [Staphylococcus equorum]QQB59566.1 hypothetical protein I6I25_12325 [Staphylococcus equorum]